MYKFYNIFLVIVTTLHMTVDLKDYRYEHGLFEWHRFPYALCNGITKVNHAAVEVVLGLQLECKCTTLLTDTFILVGFNRYRPLILYIIVWYLLEH